MTGLLSDDGFIYQRKVIIYHIIEELIKGNLAECRIELGLIANSELDEDYSLDFYIKTNENKHKFYEVKNRGSLYLKSEIKPVICNFYKLFVSIQSQDCEFILIHASQIKGKYLEKIHFTDNTKKYEAVKELLGNNNVQDFSDKVFVKQILDDIDVNLTVSGFELRCISMINKILKRYNIQRYGVAESIYHSIRTCYENLVSEASNKIKKRINSGNQPFPLKESVQISLESLLNFDNSIIDNISPKFPNRDDALNDFYGKFSIPKVSISSISI